MSLIIKDDLGLLNINLSLTLCLNVFKFVEKEIKKNKHFNKHI